MNYSPINTLLLIAVLLAVVVAIRMMMRSAGRAEKACDDDSETAAIVAALTNVMGEKKFIIKSIMESPVYAENKIEGVESEWEIAARINSFKHGVE